MNDLATEIAEVAVVLSPDAAEALAKRLAAAPKPSRLNVGSDLQAVKQLKGAWSASPDVTGGQLALALRSASAATARERERQAHSLVLTGPANAGPSPRIEQTLEQLIDAATERVLLVSFVAYKAISIVEALKRALERGVSLTIVLETEIGSEKIDLSKAKHLAPEVMAAATVLVWPIDKRAVNDKGQHGSLHAKVAVVDGERALVSSANLTGHAMDLNIEAGVLVGSQIAARLVAYFDGLRSSGQLVAVQGLGE